jgi:predicted phage terminase large subunit-like protein
MLAGEFFQYPHLHEYCSVLQAFYEDRIVWKNKKWKIVDEPIPSKSCHMLFIEMPPRHGKSRTLTMFISWVLGLNQRAKFIYTSYNDDVASDMSRYVRDTITQDKLDASDFVYSDIFDAQLQKDNKSIMKWALEGQYFNMIAAGREGSVTSKGCDYLIIDDPVKDALEALNDNISEKIWNWYTGTLLSRIEEGGKIIINHTRWPRNDLIQRIKKKHEDKQPPYYEIKFPAYDGKKMLCPELLSYSSYLEKKSLIEESIFEANFNQNVIDKKGSLYRMFRTYNIPPRDIEERRARIDVADEGDNFTCCIVYDLYQERAYVIDVLYTQERVEDYSQDIANMLVALDVSIAVFESNNGGKGLALSVEQKVQELGGTTVIDWKFSHANKKTRIEINSGKVQSYIVFPKDWRTRWPVFHEHVMNYQRVGKNKFDDAPDTLTMIAEEFDDIGVLVYG